MTSRPVPPRVVVDSEPYAWPFAGDLTGDRLAVVVAGATEDTIARCPEWPAVSAQIEVLAERARALGALIVWVGQRTVIDNPDTSIAAAGIDGFYGSALDDVLRRAGRDLLVLAGAGFETAVHSTLRSANDRGYESLTLTDASAAIDPGLAAPAASIICMSGGIFGAVAPTAALLHTLDSLEEVQCLSRN